MLRLLAATVLAGIGVAAYAGASLAESRPTIAFEMGSSEPEPVEKAPPEQWASLSPEERQQMRSQIRDHWRNIPPEERQKKREDMRERWQQMSPEERQHIRETIRERRGGDGPTGQAFAPGRR